MTFDAHANLASGVVSVAPATPTAGLTMTVVPDQGVTMPTTPFTALVFPTATAPSHANAEIVRVSINAAGAWTMTRAQEGTSARTILVGDAVYVGGVTAKTLTDLEAAIAAAIAGAQPVDSDLTAIAALAPANDDVIQRKAGAWTNRTIAQLLADLGLGSIYQPLDSDLTAIAALATTTFGRSLLTAADAAGLRTLAGLGTAATQASSAFDASGAAAAAQAASQPLDADLTAIAALTTTTFGRSLLALANAPALLAAAGAAAAAHASQHAAAGSDPITITEAQVTNLSTDLAAKAVNLVPTAVKTGAYTAAAQDFVPVDATSAGITVTLPTTPADKTRIAVKKIDASANAVTIAAGGSDVFNKAGGSTSVSLQLSNQGIQLQYASASAIWYVQAGDIGVTPLDARYEKTMISGLIAARPAASAMKGFYFATDDAGGTLYHSDGTSWTQVDKRGELGYAQITANQSGFLSAGDVTGLSIAVVVGTRPILVTCFCILQQLTSASNPSIQINEGATKLTESLQTCAINSFGMGSCSVRLTPTAGTHTYKVQASTGAGTVTVFGNANFPSYIQAVEL